MGQEFLSARGKSAFGRNYPSEDSKLKTDGSFTFLLNWLSSFFIPFLIPHSRIKYSFSKFSLTKGKILVFSG